MIGSQVGEDAHVGLQVRRIVELKRRELECEPVGRVLGACYFTQWSSDVACRLRAKARTRQHVRNQGRCGGLPIRPRDADATGLPKCDEAHVYLGVDVETRGPRRLKRWHVGGDARGHDYCSGPGDALQVVSAPLDVRTGFTQGASPGLKHRSIATV